MKFKKLWAMLVVFSLIASLIIPAENVIAATSNEPQEGDVAYWEQVIRTGDLDAIYNTQTNDELADNTGNT